MLTCCALTCRSGRPWTSGAVSSWGHRAQPVHAPLCHRIFVRWTPGEVHVRVLRQSGHPHQNPLLYVDVAMFLVCCSSAFVHVLCLPVCTAGGAFWCHCACGTYV